MFLNWPIILYLFFFRFDIDKELDQVDKQEVKKGGKKSKPLQIDTNINTSGIQLKNNIWSILYISNQYIKKKYFYFQKIRGNNSHQNRKLSGALIISYVITCDIGFNSIHKYISRLKKCQYSVCNVLCKWIVMSVLSVKMENYNNNKGIQLI